MAAAVSRLPLTTGGSGLALGMAPRGDASDVSEFLPGEGRRVILCGSASDSARSQIHHARKAGIPGRKVDPVRHGEMEKLLRRAETGWAENPERPVRLCAAESLEDLFQDQHLQTIQVSVPPTVTIVRV